MFKKLRQEKDFRVFVWTVFNAAISYAWVKLAAPELAMYSPFLVPLLNMITKYVNTKWFGDLWVKKETK